MIQNELQINHQYYKSQMQTQQRGIFKPTLKSHLLINNPSIKRYSFVEQPFKSQHQYSSVDNQNIQRDSLYPPSEQKYFSTQNNLWNGYQQTHKYNYQPQNVRKLENVSNLTVTRFDPIMPKFLFKRFLTQSQLSQTQSKHINNQLIQQLKVKKYNYPFEVQKLFRQTQEKKILYKKSLSSNMEDQNNNNMNNVDSSNSYQQSFNQYKSKDLRKIPYFPLMGTDGHIFWAHSFNKVILWRYKVQEFYNPQVFCILDFQKQYAPISAIYATQIRSSIFKNEKTILISIAFFNQLQFFSFNIEKYEKEFILKHDKNQKSEDDFRKYVQKILIKVNSNFLIEKILVQNIPNYYSVNKDLRPLIIFTDGGKDIQIVDLQNISAYKSHNQYDPFLIRKRKKDDKDQNQIIKLLHCRDEFNPMVHYAFVLRKQTTNQQIKPKTFYQKLKSMLTLTKKYQKKEQMILSIYEWNQIDLKNDTIWKKILNPSRLKKIKEITSKDLQSKLKQNFFDFFKLNINNQFIIADVSLIERNKNYKLFNRQLSQGCNLKVTFINGTSVLISNFRTLTFVSKVKVNPYIEKNVPISSCQYNNYRRLLDKGKYLKNSNQVKNKFNCYTYEAIQSQKQAKYSQIDPVVSQCNGLTICQDKIIYEDDMQILYNFSESNLRKRIYQLHLNELTNNKKSFMIFQNSFITIVETQNIADNFILLGHLYKKYPTSKQKINQYTKLIFADYNESQKINIIECIIQLLISISSSGKIRSTQSQNKIIMNDFIKGFQQRNNSNDQTAYFDQQLNSQSTKQQTYAYQFNLNIKNYQNFIQYLLGTDILIKQKQHLKNINFNNNHTNIQIKVTDHIFQFISQLLIEHGIKNVSEKHIKSIKNVLQINTSLSKYLAQSVHNSNDQKYLTNLFSGILQINQSFLTSSLSKYIMNLIQPIFDVPYKNFNKIKTLNINIVQKLEQVKTFLQGFLQFCSFKNIKNKIFQESILFCKSIQNSLPKISLLLKLFETLSQVQYYNIPLQQNHKLYSNEINLRNLLFKVGTKQILCRITVEDLFDQNSIMLDQLEQKLPQLNEINNLRFFIGWKKINSKILQNPQKIQKRNNLLKQQNSWFLNFFKTQTSSTNKSLKRMNILQNQEQRNQDYELKQKQQFLSIQKALNQYSYDDFEKFFIAKGQYCKFTNIVMSKIYYLQKNYIDLKSKYSFDEQIYENFKTYVQNQNNIQKQDNIQMNKIKQNQNQKSKLLKNGNININNNLSQFLKYEQKVCNHQKYLRTYQLIKFFNEKVLIFFDKVIIIYKNQYQKRINELLPIQNKKQSSFNTIKSSLSYNQSINTYEILILQVENLIDILITQGSSKIKNQIYKKLRNDNLLLSFIKKQSLKSTLLINNIQRGSNQQFVDIQDQKNYLVKNKINQNSIKDKQLLRINQQRKNMYQQKINQKISNQLKTQFIAKNNNNWIKNHNHKTNQLINNPKF